MSKALDLKGRIKQVIVDRMNLKIAADDISDEGSLFGGDKPGLNLDSIDALELVVGIYEEFGVELKDEDMQIFASVQTIAAFLEERLAQVR
jgi:acyl carrier protein